MVNIGSGDNKIRYDPEHWRPGQLNGGSPGYTENKMSNLRISEIHYHPGQVRRSRERQVLMIEINLNLLN